MTNLAEVGVFVCPLCGARSQHSEDIRFAYCGHCHAFTGRCAVWGCRWAPKVVRGNIALCALDAADVDSALRRRRGR